MESGPRDESQRPRLGIHADPGCMAPFVAFAPIKCLLALRGTCRALREMCDERMARVFPNCYAKKRRTLLDIVSERKLSPKRCIYFECDLEFCLEMFDTFREAASSGRDLAVARRHRLVGEYRSRKFGRYCSFTAYSVLRRNIPREWATSMIFGAMSAGRGDFYGECLAAGFAAADLWDHEKMNTVLSWGGLGAQRAYMANCAIERDHEAIMKVQYVFINECVQDYLSLFCEVLRRHAARATESGSTIYFAPLDRAVDQDDVTVLTAFMQVIGRRECQNLNDRFEYGNWSFQTRCLGYLAREWCGKNDSVTPNRIMRALATRDDYDGDLEILKIAERAGGTIPYDFAAYSSDHRWIERYMEKVMAGTALKELHDCEWAFSKHLNVLLDRVTPEHLRECYAECNPEGAHWKECTRRNNCCKIVEGLQLMGLKQ